MTEVRAFPPHWKEFLKCPRCRRAFLRVSDMRHVYPLCEVHSRKGEKVLEYGTEEEIEDAFRHLRHVDPYTMATGNFNWRLEQLWFREITDREPL